jgi:hypothetical protein
MVWAFVFPSSFDGVFIAYTVARTASYFVTNGECAINYHEKRLFDPTYVMGSDPQDEPYVTSLPPVLQWAFLAALLTLMPYMIFVTIATYKNPGRRASRYVIALLATGVAYHGFVKFAAVKVRTLVARHGTGTSTHR